MQWLKKLFEKLAENFAKIEFINILKVLGKFFVIIFITLSILVIIFSIGTIAWIVLLSITFLLCICLRFTIVREGTAKTVVRLGAFRKIIMIWHGYIINQDGEVVKKDSGGYNIGLHLPGGLSFVGIWPFDRVYEYSFRWRDIQLIGTEEKVEFHEKKDLDYIFVRPDVYWTEIKKAETKPPERIPLNVQFLVTLRVVNPYKALFVAPSNWNENVMIRLNAMLRDWIASKFLDTILRLHKESEKIIEELDPNYPLIAFLKETWGVEVQAIEIRDIDMQEDYQKAAAEQAKKKMLAKAIASDTLGVVMETMAMARGKKVEDIQKEIEEKPELQKEFLEYIKEFNLRIKEAERGAFFRLVGTGGPADLIVAWKKLTGSKPKEIAPQASNPEWEQKKSLIKELAQKEGVLENDPRISKSDLQRFYQEEIKK